MQFAQARRITSSGSNLASGRPVLHSIAFGQVARSRELARIKAFRRQGLRTARNLGCGAGLAGTLPKLDELSFESCQSDTTNVPRPTSARTNLRLPNRSNAELMVVALTLINPESRRTVGRRSPGLNSPVRMARSKKAASCS